MRCVAVLFLVTACNAGGPEHTLEDPAISEASGLARSNYERGLFWVINDGGSSPTLFAVGEDGSDRGSVILRNSDNIDWEDLASFEADGKSWLIIADIGDNQARRPEVTMYLVEEPSISDESITPARRISFRYSDGPRDAEAVAVDVDNRRILILSKRTIPSELYSLPLEYVSLGGITAQKLGEITSIPQPDQHDLDRAIPDNNWHWQPTGFDIANTGRSAVILTYSAIYEYRRHTGESWFDALQAEPVRLPIGKFRLAEAIAFDSTGNRVFVTGEGQHAPMLRLELEH